MKGTLKAIKRTPFQLTSKVGMSSKSSDADTEELKRRFAVVEQETGKLYKDAKSYRDGVANMLLSSGNFADAFATLFSPIGAEADLSSRYPSAAQTIENVGIYQGEISDLRDAVQPELDLVDSRILAPVKEYMEVLKKVNKSIVKRDHKLVDFDRHNNSYLKLRDKKEKTLKDEQNMFKVEQDYELAMQEYEHFNGQIKTELPRFLELTTAFISPLFHSFYYMQLNILYITLEKIQSFTNGKFDMTETDIQGLFLSRLGTAGEDLEGLSITKRFVSTAKLMSTHRQDSNETVASGSTGYKSPPSLSAKPSFGSKPSISPKPSYGSSLKSGGLPPMPAPVAAAPPPYSPSAGVAPAAGKRPPPPPPAPKPKPKPAVMYVTAIYDFVAQADGDLSFSTGDRIELVKKTDSADDWWTGKVNGQTGVFPGTYVQDG